MVLAGSRRCRSFLRGLDSLARAENIRDRCRAVRRPFSVARSACEAAGMFLVGLRSRPSAQHRPRPIRTTGDQAVVEELRLRPAAPVSSGADAERARQLDPSPAARRRRRSTQFDQLVALADRLAHQVAERHVGGGQRRRWRQRPAERRCPARRRPSASRPCVSRSRSMRCRGLRRAPRSAPRHWPRTGTGAGAGCRRRGWCAPSIRPASPAPARTAAGRGAAACRRSASRRRRRMASSSAASSSTVQARRSSNTRFAMLAAAALVKVMQRMRAGFDAATAAAGSRAAPARGSCPSRHWPRPRPSCRGSTTAVCRSVTAGGMSRGLLIRRRVLVGRRRSSDHSWTRARWS